MLMFNILMENLEKAGYSSRPRYALEMALVKAVQAGDVVPVTKILGRLDEILQTAGIGDETAGLELRAAEKKTADTGDAVTTNLSSETVPVKKDDAGQWQGAVVSSISGQADDGGKECAAQGEYTRPINEEIPAKASEKEHDESKESDKRIIRQRWNDFISYVKDRKPWMASALQMADSAQLKKGELVVEYENSAHCSMLRNRENITLLTEFALDFFQEDFRIRFHVPESGGCEVDPANGNKVKQERKALANDSLVLTAVDIFNGEVGDIRIGPRFRGPIHETENTDTEEPLDEC